MKYRKLFVSNSSTSSYVVAGKKIPKDTIYNFVLEDYDDENESLHDYFDRKGLCYIDNLPNNVTYVIIGICISSISSFDIASEFFDPKDVYNAYQTLQRHGIYGKPICYHYMS